MSEIHGEIKFKAVKQAGKSFLRLLLLLAPATLWPLTFPWDETGVNPCENLVIVDSDLHSEDRSQFALWCSLQSTFATMRFMQTRQTQFSVNNTLANLDIIIDPDAGNFLKLFPRDFQGKIWLFEKALVKFYRSSAKLYRSLNPFPQLHYFIRSRSPAFPFVTISGVEDLSSSLETFPYLDDERWHLSGRDKRSYGIGFVLPFYGSRAPEKSQLRKSGRHPVRNRMPEDPAQKIR